MATACVQFRRTSTGWEPVGVWLATEKGVEARMLPGDDGLERFRTRMLTDSQRPRLGRDIDVRGSWEDWMDWFVWSMSNGADRWMSACTPEPTLDMLYAREVLRENPARYAPSRAPEVTTTVPALSGPAAQPAPPTPPAPAATPAPAPAAPTTPTARKGKK